MKFRIVTSKFTEAINDVSRALSTKTPMPILKNIKMDVVKDGIHLTASNSNITIKMFLPAIIEGKSIMDIQEEGSAALPGRLLLEVLRKANEEHIDIALFENKFLKVTFGNSDYTLNCLDVREYPNISIISSENPFTISAQLLHEVIGQTIISVTMNESRPILTGVNFIIKEGKLTCVATDSYRLSQKVIDINVDPTVDIDIIVPGKSLQELDKILFNSDEMVEIHLNNNMILFKFDNMIFQSRLINGKFPDTTRLIPSEFGLVLTLSRLDLIEVVERVSLLSREGATNIIKFDIFEDRTIISLDSPEIGKVKEEIVPLNLEGSVIRIGFNSKYLLDALRVLEDDEIQMKFTGEVRPFIVQGSDLSNTQLILPVRIE